MIGEKATKKARKISDVSAIRKVQSSHLQYRDDSERLSTSVRESKIPRNSKLNEIMREKSKGEDRDSERRDKKDSTPRKPSPLRKNVVIEESEQSNDEEDEEPEKPARKKSKGGGQPPDDDPSDSSDSSRPPRRSSDRKPKDTFRDLSKSSERTTKEPQFDLKLKIESVPKWNGNTDNIVKWFARINDLGTLSDTIYEQLGRVVPKRLEGSAETWYFSLPSEHRKKIEKDWGTLKEALGAYYMNRRWMDKQKSRAIRAYYRESGYYKELPSEYVIRKAELIRTIHDYDDTELIMEIMEGAPTSWNTVLTTQLYRDMVEFQNAIHFHEDTLIKLGEEKRERYDSDRYRDRNYSRNNYKTAHTRLVGWSKNLTSTEIPKG